MSVAVKSGTGAHPLPGPAAGVLNESGGCFQFLPPGGNPAGEEFGRGRNDKQVQDGGCHQPAELDDGQGAEQFASGLVNGPDQREQPQHGSQGSHDDGDHAFQRTFPYGFRGFHPLMF